ncbi:MAG: hypothetical protein LBG88_02970 [Christensenellaceae bacterium]|jgi:hypothetical protein|nr:hypothetical protein [Christensenellaceae bacterium]
MIVTNPTPLKRVLNLYLPATQFLRTQKLKPQENEYGDEVKLKDLFYLAKETLPGYSPLLNKEYKNAKRRREIVLGCSSGVSYDGDKTEIMINGSDDLLNALDSLVHELTHVYMNKRCLTGTWAREILPRASEAYLLDYLNNLKIDTTSITDYTLDNFILEQRVDSAIPYIEDLKSGLDNGKYKHCLDDVDMCNAGDFDLPIDCYKHFYGSLGSLAISKNIACAKYSFDHSLETLSSGKACYATKLEHLDVNGKATLDATKDFAERHI